MCTDCSPVARSSSLTHTLSLHATDPRFSHSSAALLSSPCPPARSLGQSRPPSPLPPPLWATPRAHTHTHTHARAPRQHDELSDHSFVVSSRRTLSRRCARPPSGALEATAPANPPPPRLAPPRTITSLRPFPPLRRSDYPSGETDGAGVGWDAAGRWTGGGSGTGGSREEPGCGGRGRLPALSGRGGAQRLPYVGHEDV